MPFHLPDQIPVNEAYADGFDDSSDEEAESSRSLASSAYDYRYENGRRYHGYRDGAHVFPNDELNAEHEKMTHHLFMRLFGDKLYVAPVQSPRNVIDLGTGIGLWAKDFADHHEDARVTGVDLSPVSKDSRPNLEFVLDDIREEWTHATKFDFVHIRLLFGTLSDWPALYKHCFDNMEPGGYIQQIEIELKPWCDDGTCPPDSVFHRWREIAVQFNAASRKDFFISDAMKQYLAAVGFVDIVEERFKMPLGAWSSNEHYREIGKYFELYWRTGAQGWIMAPATRFLNWTPEMVNDFCKDTVKAFDERNQHLYYYAVVIYARKP